MDGTVSIQSEAGAGTKVTCTFHAEIAPENESPDSEKEKDTVIRDVPFSLLLVEDDAVNRYAVSRILEKRGAEVTCAENGLEALDVLRKENFDCIIMDIQMPGMDGIETTRNIRNSDKIVRGKEVPIIALTAHALTGEREEFMSAGMDDYLTKPVRAAVLIEKIHQHCGK